MSIWHWILFISICFLSCSKSRKENMTVLEKNSIETIQIPPRHVDFKSLRFLREKSLWMNNDSVFSGYSLSLYPDSTVKQKFGVYKGKKQNESVDYYPDGHLKRLASYHQGRLFGEKKTWSSDSSHILISHLNFYNGKPHGIQKKWYPSGEIFKVFNFNMGREEGIQKAFRKNGVLFANYEAKGGRIYGLKKAELCFGLTDGEIDKEKK